MEEKLNNSEISSKTSYLKKIENLNLEFQKEGKEMDSELTEEEIRDFIYKRSKNFDERLIQKILEKLENIDHIKVEDFINAWVELENDLIETEEDLKKKVAKGKSDLRSQEEDIRRYKDENLNENGISNDARIILIIKEIILFKQIPELVKVSLHIKYNEDTKEKNFHFTGSNIQVNETFEFNPKSKKDLFLLTLMGEEQNGNFIKIGSQYFNIEGEESHEKYDLTIEIFEGNNKKNITSKIICEIDYFWSQYSAIEGKKKKTEKEVKTLEKNLLKMSQYCQMISGIYDNNNNKKDLINEQYEEQVISENQSRNRKEDIVSAIINTDQPMNTNDQLSTMILNPEERKWNNINKIFGIAISIISGLCCFSKTDFPNLLGGISAFITGMVASKNPKINEEIFKRLLFFIIGLIIYDIIWMVFEFGTYLHGRDDYTGGNEDVVLKFTLFLTIANLILKSFLSFGIWKKIKSRK